MHRFADDPILTKGLEYWLDLPKEAEVPDRRNLDPSQMPRLIVSNVALLEFIDDRADARFRLAGQEFDDNFGFSLKGKTISELTEGKYRHYMLGHLRMLIETRRPIYSESTFRWDRGGLLRTRRLMMPLSHGEPGVIALIFKVQTWPRDAMRGLPLCDVIGNSSEICNSKAQPVPDNNG